MLAVLDDWLATGQNNLFLVLVLHSYAVIVSNLRVDISFSVPLSRITSVTVVQ